MGNEVCVPGESAEQEQRDQLADSDVSGEMAVTCTGATVSVKDEVRLERRETRHS